MKKRKTARRITEVVLSALAVLPALTYDAGKQSEQDGSTGSIGNEEFSPNVNCIRAQMYRANQ